MSFEICDRDLLARIGRLKTKSGTLETPLLLPVINPTIQPIPPKTIQDEFNHPAIITNAYIIRKHYKDEATRKGIHNLLDFQKVIMTDSGAYQLLVYGDIEATPEEIVKYQEAINTDIATILDIPTGWNASRRHATYTVRETLTRAQDLDNMKSRHDILWVGPIQGGQHLDLIAQSAREMGKLPFHVHALGSPTPVMEQYLFDTLVDMILAAKRNSPPERPLHLFGAGHPFMFALAVALGCDLFDSAAYAIYARDDRYMTEYGTLQLKDLAYFPCSCPTCIKTDPRETKMLGKPERQKLLAQHNLFVSLAELKRIKQAIVEGRLWEHLESRAHGHPALLQGVKRLRKYESYLEVQSPITKRAGLFFFGSLGLARPEVVRHRKRLFERYAAPDETRILVLLPQTRMKPFHKSREQRRILVAILRRLGANTEEVHMCTCAAPFGIVPTVLDEVYPLSQYEIAVPFDAETVAYVARQVRHYIAATKYEKVILLQDREAWKGRIATACREACSKANISFQVLEAGSSWEKSALESLMIAIANSLG